MFRIAFLAILIAGCHGGDKPTAASGNVVPSVGAAGPAQFADVAAGDTAGVLDLMRQTMQQVDAGLPAMTRRDTTLAAVADSVPRHLTVWLQGNDIRKLTSQPDSTANGPNDGETDVWFVGGDIAVVQRVADAYAFDAGRIVLWTDESLLPRGDVTADQLMTRETELGTLIRSWAAVFGVQLP
ncbi:MAG TPA: hypothetical protein VGM77_12175 [Gemmatimonadales bacterium]|jgi:hypothetical protein